MLCITLRDRKSNTWIQQQTGGKDIIEIIKKGKHRWAGHVSPLGALLEQDSGKELVQQSNQIPRLHMTQYSQR